MSECEFNGKPHLYFLIDNGKYDSVTDIHNAVYVPSSTFNIIPPQMIIANMNIKDNLDVKYSKHDDTEYVISFKEKYWQLTYYSLTIPIGGNGILQLCTKPGYTSFLERANNLQYYECYTGARLILESDEDPDVDTGNPRDQSTRKPREPLEYQSAL